MDGSVKPTVAHGKRARIGVSYNAATSYIDCYFWRHPAVRYHHIGTAFYVAYETG